MKNLVETLLECARVKKPIITVVGDSLVDHWIHGYVTSCQDNCAKFVKESIVITPGGADNAYNTLSEWTSEGVFLYLFGQFDRDIPIKTRFINKDGAIVFRYDDERTNLKEYMYVNKYERMLDEVANSNAVLISDYDKGFLTPAMINNIVEACNWRGIPCVADVKRQPVIYGNAILKGNSNWRANWCGSNCHVVTRGDQSPIIHGKPLDVNLPLVKCVNHVGAGDCFAAHLTLALSCGFHLEDAARLAHSAGRVYVQAPHNRPPRPAEIDADLSGHVLNLV